MSEQKDYTCLILTDDQAIQLYDDLEVYIKKKHMWSSVGHGLTHSVNFVKGSIKTAPISEEEYKKMVDYKKD